MIRHIAHHPLFRSALIGALILSPSVALEAFLIHKEVPLNTPYLAACLILLLAAADFAVILMIEPQWRRLSKFTFPAFISAIGVIFLYVLMDTANRFFEHFGYDLLTPFVAATMLLIYTAVFMERNIALKFYLSLNSIAVTLLWTMGTVDKITMPF